ncbi:protein kinase [Spirillospora sp. NPDC047279]|uniref:protein kinase domain-containing protein n=1 Tax=Spirillospora sp. NPDC047279 TaxID=3155478 RepID=UPI0033E7FECA
MSQADLPTRIGPYRVMERLGEGGMGIVYLGTDEKGQQVAIKVIRREYAADARFRARFESEVSAAQRVRPFCTAPVLDADPKADPPYLVTEYVSGSSLAAAVDRQGALRGADLEALAVGMASALTAIHDAGVVHRDLKPANVLLSPYGPRVIDFGIARADDMTRLTATGGIVGTPAFMAPEQLNGKPATPASDVFAWGATVAYAAKGSTCFGGNSVPAMMHAIMSGEPDLRGLQGTVLDVVKAALAKDPAKRPTAQRLLERLVSSASTRHTQDQPKPPATEPSLASQAAPPPASSISTPPASSHSTPPPVLPPPAVGTDQAAALVERQYREAAEAGDTAAMYNLGVLLSWRGQTGEADYWYRRAAAGSGGGHHSQPGYGQSVYGQSAFGQSAYGHPTYPSQSYAPSGYTTAPPVPQQPRYNHLAIYAMTLGLVGLISCGLTSIPAIVLGHLAWRQIGRTQQRGLGMAATGLALGYLLVAFWLLVAFGASLPDTDPDPGNTGLPTPAGT